MPTMHAMSKSDVVVVGSYNQDLTWYTSTFPRPGETVMGRFSTGPGGKGSNQAVAACRAGAATAYVGAIGEDHFGKPLPAFYEKEGIAHRLAVKSDHPTGNAGIWVDEFGRNDIIVALGANMALTPDDVPRELIADAEIVVCQQEVNLEANYRAFEIARKHGVKTLLNPAPTRNDFSENILELTDVLVPNETEFVEMVTRLGFYEGTGFTEEVLSEMKDAELHDLCRRFPVSSVIVTLGKRGCLVSTEVEYRKIPTINVEKVVDTCGAGDAFVGGFSAGWVRYGKDIFKAAEYGNIVAGLSVTRPGTAPSMPMLNEIEPLLRAL